MRTIAWPDAGSACAAILAGGGRIVLVRYAMEKEVRIAGDDGVRAVIEAILAHHQEAAMVFDARGSLLGVVDTNTILKRLLPAYMSGGVSLAEALHEGYFEEVFAELATVTAADLMEPLAETDSVAPDDGVMKAAALFVEHHREVLPVLEDDRPIGVISRRGLLARALKRSA